MRRSRQMQLQLMGGKRIGVRMGNVPAKHTRNGGIRLDRRDHRFQPVFVDWQRVLCDQRDKFAARHADPEIASLAMSEFLRWNGM